MELNEFLKKCNDNDVLCYEEKLFKLETIKNAINLTFNDLDILNVILNYFKKNKLDISKHDLFKSNIPISILKSDSKGWQKGKLKIKVVLEFEPDEPKEKEEINNHKVDDNSLDDIRSTISQQ